VDNHQNFVEDDDNDTALFERLQKRVLENCPNPERVGCPSPAILRAFVEDPASVTPAELNELHILKCAECTRELMTLRGKRESIKISNLPTLERNRPHLAWREVVLTVMCGVIVAAVVHLGGDLFRTRTTTTKDAIVSKAIDLSSYAATRGSEQGGGDQVISLPRTKLDLDLLLPYPSKAGRYRVTVTKHEDGTEVLTAVTGTTVVAGTRTKLRIVLDLSEFSPGRYYLDLIEQSESEPQLFPIDLE